MTRAEFIVVGVVLCAAVVAAGRTARSTTPVASTRSDPAPSNDILQFSLSDPDGQENVVVLDVTADDRLDYKISNDDGSYQYGYQTGRLRDGGHSFKHEYRRPDGVIFGQHGYHLPGGVNKTTNYVADEHGYRVLRNGQKYQPVAVNSAENKELHEKTTGPSAPDIELLKYIKNAETIELESDANKLLKPEQISPKWHHDPDTGAYRFQYRTVGKDGSVAFRSEVRRPDGLVYGQYGHSDVVSGAANRQILAKRRGLVDTDLEHAVDGRTRNPEVVSYVSDVYGYRLVDPSKGSIPILTHRAASNLQQKERLGVSSSDINDLEENVENGVEQRHKTLSRQQRVKLNRKAPSRSDEVKEINLVNVRTRNELVDARPDLSMSSIDMDELSGFRDDWSDQDYEFVPSDDSIHLGKPLHLEETGDLPDPSDKNEENNLISEDHELNSIVIEAAHDSNDSNHIEKTPESDISESIDRRTPSILQLLAPYPPSVSLGGVSPITSRSSHQLQPYGAMQQLLSRSNDIIANIKPERSIDGVSQHPATAALMYQSMPYALVPLSLLPIRTYRVEHGRSKSESHQPFSITVQQDPAVTERRLL